MGKGSNSTVTNVQALPPAVQDALEQAYTDFNPFQAAFSQVSAFDPTAPLAGTANLSTGETSILYAKVMGLDGIYESIEITTPDYEDFLIMDDVVEMNQ